MRSLKMLCLLSLACVLLAACASTGEADTSEAHSEPPQGGSPLPAGANVDYQLGGAYAPPSGVQLVVRDRTEKPADGVYSVCYVNGFQTQPGESGSWPAQALLKRNGKDVVDANWPDEVLLDASTAAKRQLIIDNVGPWIRGCAQAGFTAVEFDNLDSFSRSDGAFTLEDNLAVAKEFVAIAHEAGLAAGQKNAAEYAAQLKQESGFDFAVSEECGAFHECADYTDVYGTQVIDIEYTDNLPRPFAELCGDGAVPPSTVLRDRMLVTPDNPDYVRGTCSHPAQ